MSALLTERDVQAGLGQAWHGDTTIVTEVTRDNSMPFEVIESPISYKVVQADENGLPQDTYIEDPEFKTLLASDDLKPVGEPYASSYHPSNIEGFWEIIRKGMDGVPHQIISAGTVDNRRKIFASLKVSEGFRVGDREFKDFITLIDSFDKSTSLQSRYSNVCVVCANTFAAVMNSGETIGKARHTAMIEVHIQKLIDAIKGFTGTSSDYQQMLTKAHETPCSRDEARAWLMGIETRNTKKEPTNGMLQKVARQVELFDKGEGNEGRTRLDALSAITDFHTNESSNRQAKGAQYSSSEWGASGSLKTQIVSTFESQWDVFSRNGGLALEEKTSELATA